jgi:hypothetical protein
MAKTSIRYSFWIDQAMANLLKMLEFRLVASWISECLFAFVPRSSGDSIQRALRHQHRSHSSDWLARSRAAMLVLAALASPVVQANYACQGKVSYLGLDASGDLTVAVTGTPIHKICNVEARDSTVFAASPVTCRTMYAALLTAKISDRPVALYFHPNGFSCSSFPSWGRVPGMYFLQGPE